MQTDSYTAPATNNAKEATVTTNDQPSPTDPTPTPHSEPESSTGPDKLEWTERGDGHHYIAATHSGGNYSVYFGDAFENPHRWHTVCWRENQGSLNVDRGELYRGDDLDEALAAAQQHHRATLRSLAWEQYMRDNDPPAGGATNYLINQCGQAQFAAIIARQTLGLP